jgi:putative DNA primase/helicase
MNAPIPNRFAIEAASLVSGKLAIPEFGPDRSPDQTDFNDMAQRSGLEAVKECIKRAITPTPDVMTEAHELYVDSFPEPTPLPKLPQVPDFPIDLLPNDLQAYVRDAAERARYRPEFGAVPLMVALGSVIGRKLGIRLKEHDDWTEFGNIWGAIVGPPSALKSPAMRDALLPFRALQLAADEEHSSLEAEYQIQAKVAKLRSEAEEKTIKQRLSKDPQATVAFNHCEGFEAPTPRTYWTSDATAEKLGVLLAENSNGLLVERDELSSLLQTLEDEKHATARGLYLSGWSGKEGYRFDRIGRGTTSLPKFALSVIGGIQPGPLERYVRSAFSGERADGMLQRFQLIVWPESEHFEFVDRRPNELAKQAAKQLFERADRLNPDSIGQPPDFQGTPPFVRFSKSAQPIFNDWYTTFMTERRRIEAERFESAPVCAHFGKYPGLVGKLALIIHIADEPNSREVSDTSLLKALAWINYLTPHARRVYHAVDNPETGAAGLLLARLKRGELPVAFKAYEISRKGWQGLGDREAVKKACRLLMEHSWLIEIDPGGPQSMGRPTDSTYSVSPAVGG